MLEKLVADAKKKLRLSPLIAVACPGNILPDGSIEPIGTGLGNAHFTNRRTA
jgi:hypothetical protein